MTDTFTAAGLTDVGQRREKNEDAFLLRPDDGVLIVADGLGGRPAGEVASRLACDTAYSSLMRNGHGAGLADRMAEAVTSANQTIWEESRNDPQTAGMGTTVTSLLVDRQAALIGIGHVGDSRAYRFRHGKLEQLTTDHTLVQELLEAGAITQEEAEGHPLGYLLNRAVGTEPEVKVQTITEPVFPGDVFLLCTDGLLAVLTPAEIEGVLAEHISGPDGPVLDSTVLEEVVSTLVRQANEGGAPDNVTVGMLGVSSD